MTTSPDAAAFFGDWVALYDARYDERSADGHALRARMEVVLGLLGRGPGAVLDAGMGPGRLGAELAARGWTVSGVDAAEEMVEVARKRLAEAAERLVHAELESLPFPDASFDAVAATGVLEYVRVAPALRELRRVLRPGGLAVVSYPNPHALYGVWKSRAWYPAVRSAKRLLRRPGAAFPRGGAPVPPEHFAQLLAEAGLSLGTIAHASYLVVPTPLDLAAPALSARIGERVEGAGGSYRARLLATQVVYAARNLG